LLGVVVITFTTWHLNNRSISVSFDTDVETRWNSGIGHLSPAFS